MVRCGEIGTGYTTNSVLARGEGGYSFNIYMQSLIIVQFLIIVQAKNLTMIILDGMKRKPQR